MPSDDRTKYTPEQRDAVTIQDRNLVVVAGAGSGKTHVLVERYIALLQTNPNWALNNIVAITFTDKAAAEMRARVRQRLGEQVSHAAPEHAERWASLLAAMDSARIETIHALCTALLRANAAEAGIDPKFEVLDDVDAEELREAAVEAALRDALNTDAPVLALLDEYDLTQVREHLIGAIREGLLHRAPPTPDTPEALYEFWRAQRAINAQKTLDDLGKNAAFAQAAGWQPAPGFPKGDDLMLPFWRGAQTSFRALSDASADLQARLNALDGFLTINLKGGKGDAWGGKEAVAELKAALKLLRETAEIADARIGTLTDADQHAAALAIHWRSLLARAETHYEAAKTERATLDFNDLERRARDLMGSAEVRARYAGREFRHLLVDEFQDTNADQWAIIGALAPPDMPGGLFIVGDPKQSIYGFRGADVRVFEQVREHITATNGHEVTLARSFRTHRPLVDTLNAAFARILKREGETNTEYHIELGTPMTAERDTSPSDDAPIEFIAIDHAAAKDQDEDGQSAFCRTWEAGAIAERLRTIIEGGRVIHDKKSGVVRPATYSDVVILFQAFSNVPLYETALRDASIPYLTIAGKGYYDRQEIWDVINLLKTLRNRRDELALASALHSPFFNLSDDALLALRLVVRADGQPEPLWTTLGMAADGEVALFPEDERRTAQFAYETLSELHAIAGRVTIGELLRAALDRTGYLATITGVPDGARRRLNLEKLLEKTQSGGTITLSGFTNTLENLAAREVREGEAVMQADGAVTLMTVHKSKGLEFPIVVLADCSYDGVKNDTSILMLDTVLGFAPRVHDDETMKMAHSYASSQAYQVQKDRADAERRRLLYVAATRAQDLLIISGQVKWADKETKHNSGGWMGQLIDAGDLADTLLDGLRSEPRQTVIDYDAAWGKTRIHMPLPPTPVQGRRAHAQPIVWVAAPTGNYAMPPNVRPVRIAPDAPTRSMTATLIADLGGAIMGVDAHEQAEYKMRWRRKALHDAPSQVFGVSAFAARRRRARLIGEIVHSALRWAQPGRDGADVLEYYAWELGIVDAEECREMVKKAADLLKQVQTSQVQGWINRARRVYRELPFVFQNDARVIYGIMDVLIEREDGTWAVIDYKTSRPRQNVSFEAHAKRYTLQVGVYAAAAEYLLGIENIEVYVHYLHPNITISIPRVEWTRALGEMERYIGQMVEVGIETPDEV